MLVRGVVFLVRGGTFPWAEGEGLTLFHEFPASVLVSVYFREAFGGL